MHTVCAATENVNNTDTNNIPPAPEANAAGANATRMLTERSRRNGFLL